MGKKEVEAEISNDSTFFKVMLGTKEITKKVSEQIEENKGLKVHF